jgi:large subunit ribosomal protein L2
MLLRPCKPYSAGSRFKTILYFNDLSRVKPERALTCGQSNSGGRNNRGIITVRGRGGGHKRKYRLIDFKRLILYRTIVPPNKIDYVNSLEKEEFKLLLDPELSLYKSAEVLTIEYDPNRNARIALLCYEDGSRRYILCPRFLKVGLEVVCGKDAPIEVGNALPLGFIPLGSIIHNIELSLGKGGQIARAAGTSAKLIAKEGQFVTLQLPSKEIRLVNKQCYATLGQVGNVASNKVTIGKAGRNRWLGKRPKVRGSAKNPNDHPHGGGEGRASIGLPRPLTPWGKPALGVKTRKKKKRSSKLILRSRK